MKNKFTKEIAKEIANNSLVFMLDCILGHDDSGYDLYSNVEEFEDNFTEELEELGIKVTKARLSTISKIYEKEATKIRKYVENFKRNI
jgi:hypothetical protein